MFKSVEEMYEGVYKTKIAGFPLLCFLTDCNGQSRDGLTSAMENGISVCVFLVESNSSYLLSCVKAEWSIFSC